MDDRRLAVHVDFPPQPANVDVDHVIERARPALFFPDLTDQGFSGDDLSRMPGEVFEQLDSFDVSSTGVPARRTRRATTSTVKLPAVVSSESTVRPCRSSDRIRARSSANANGLTT